MSDWTSFGRVDDDGTVYVKTAAGERVVGSWQAGTPEEGLAHFGRRFADIVTEVDLIEARLGTGAADPGHTVTSLRRIRTSLDDAHVVGDLDGLAARIDKLVSVAEGKTAEARAAREVARTEALARKTSLVEEAEAIGAESTQWKSAGDRLRTILDEWKTIKGIDKKTDGELWKRYSPRHPLCQPRLSAQGGHRPQGGAGHRGRVTVGLVRLERHRQQAQGADGRVEGRAARAQGGRAAAVGAVPGRPGRVLRTPQRGLLRPRR